MHLGGALELRTASSIMEEQEQSQSQTLEPNLLSLDTTPYEERPIDVPVDNDVTYIQYTSETQMPDIMRLMKADLSEPYSIYTYRYFIHNWPHLCFMVCRTLTIIISVKKRLSKCSKEPLGLVD